MEEINIDGKNLVLGRTASVVARHLLGGKNVNIVNAEKMIITGDPDEIIAKYIARRQRGSPQHGPFFPIKPDMLVKRTIRGMLPYKTNKGRNAFKNLKVYTGKPDKIKTETGETKKIKTRYITVEKLSLAIGWNKK
ncbi:MAG TPA: 50S ribosomal protein L13 [archaeon]|nr:50S ribosomal protein L13 [Candidatus Nanoarchaeia archaeon]HLD84983.1 50S ribosomal protein L13 [archaeon]